NRCCLYYLVARWESLNCSWFSNLADMTTLFIIVQTRESDEKAAELLRHLIEKGDVKEGPLTQDLDPKTIILSFQDIHPDVSSRIISDSKQWCEDVGFVFLVNKDTVHSSISLQNGTIENENATVVSLLEL
ncbi:MAG: hypothetical protein ACREBS_09850, partial [Nitrososphaerales archaeon]